MAGPLRACINYLIDDPERGVCRKEYETGAAVDIDLHVCSPGKTMCVSYKAATGSTALIDHPVELGLGRGLRDLRALVRVQGSQVAIACSQNPVPVSNLVDRRIMEQMPDKAAPRLLASPVTWQRHRLTSC